jgi:AmpD protein
MLVVNPESGLIAGVRHVHSPNCDARPDDCDPELIVVHGISLPPGEFGGPWIDELFTNRLDRTVHPYFEEIAGLEVSSHVLIRRDGEVTQFVPFTRRAWHAGESDYCGRARCNDYSVGIELEGEDDTPYSDAQYAALCETIIALGKAYPTLSAAPITGHCHVAPGRKTDPGAAFDWPRLNRSLRLRGVCHELPADAVDGETG